MFKSIDGGQTWVKASQGLPAPLFIDSVTISPFHPNILYAWAGIGGYVSTNGAGSWSPLNTLWPQGTSVTGGGLHFSFDPLAPGILYGPAYANSRLGIQKSVDGGATWMSYQFPAGQGGPLTVDPANPQIMLAGEFRSTDGGQTWRPTNASRQIQPVFAPSSGALVYATAPITSDAFLAKFLPDGKTLAFSTYFGGMGNDTGQGIALDAAGDIWITGSTSSYDLPATPGSFQNTLEGETNAFTAKFSNDGKLLAATYLGGSNNDAGLGIAVDPRGNPWLIGSWTSTDFPFTTAPPASLPFPTAGFLTAFDPSAARLLYSTNVNGTFDANGKGIAIDSSGNITLVGSNYGSFPITSGAFHGGDASLQSPKVFVLKLTPSGQVIYSTSFGGTHVAPTTGSYEGEHDNGVAVAVDDGGNAYITGYTSAADFPVTAGAYQTSFAAGCPYPAFTIATGMIGTLAQWLADDVFVVKLSPDGKAAIFSTLLGGSCYDHPTSIALDAFGRVYITGETDSADFPLVSSFEPAPPVRQFASFLSVFNPAGSALSFSTYLYAGAAPSVVVGPGRLTYVVGSSGTGAQTQPDSGFTNPFPLTATDGYLALIRPPEPFPGRLPPPRHRVISHYNQAHF